MNHRRRIHLVWMRRFCLGTKFQIPTAGKDASSVCKKLLFSQRGPHLSIESLQRETRNGLP